MKLRVKKFSVSAGRPIVFLNVLDAKNMGVNVGDRVEVIKKGKKIVSRVDLVNDFLNEGEVSLTSDILKLIKVMPGDHIDIEIITKQDSEQFIAKKMNNKELTKEEILSIMEDIVSNTLTEAEVAQFVVAMYHNGMTHKETVYLTQAMCDTGLVLKWGKKIVADKHCIGGIAGNRTTPIVISICAAAGLTMPKTSSRAITSAAGTADVIETMAKVDFPAKELQRIVNKVGACLAWGGSLGLAPADDKLIKIERILRVDPEAQLLASILSKKISAGSTHVLIDIPCGNGAKVTTAEANNLAKKFISLGKSFGLTIKVILTDGSQPIGNGVGPVLEMIDVIKVLKRENGPADLEKKSIMLAGTLLEMTGKAKKGKGEILARDILESGKALRKFEEILVAQGRKKGGLKVGRYKYTIKSEKSGVIKALNNKEINGLATLLGCPQDKGSGIYLHKHIGDRIQKGENLLTLYAESFEKLIEGKKVYKQTEAIRIS